MKRLTHHITNILIPLLPALFFLGWMTFQWQMPVDAFYPSLSDEIFVWHQAASFAEVGFDNGYYTRDEAIPRLEGVHYYAWGLGRPIFLGTIARIFGWELYTPVILNLFMLTVAGLFFTYSHELDRKQKLALALLLLVYPVILLYMRLAMVEIIQISFGWIWATLFLRWQKDFRRSFFVVLLVYTMALALFQVSWAFLFLPLLYIAFCQTYHHLRALIGSLVMSAVGIVLAYLVQSLTAAPYPGILSNLVILASQDIVQGFVALMNHIIQNLSLILRGEPLFILQRIILLMLIGWSIFGMGGVFKRYEDTETPSSYYWVIFLALSITFFATIVNFTFMGSEFRVFSHIIFVAMMLLIVQRQLRIVSMVVILYTMILPITLNRSHSSDLHENFPQDYAISNEFFERGGVSYEQDASSPWCNTVLMTRRFLNISAHLLAVPAGMGLSFTYDQESMGALLPIKSKYVLIDEVMHNTLIDLYPAYANAMIEIGRDGMTSYSIENNTLLLLNQASALRFPELRGQAL